MTQQDDTEGAMSVCLLVVLASRMKRSVLTPPVRNTAGIVALLVRVGAFLSSFDGSTNSQ
jgi:hypothetical protein